MSFFNASNFSFGSHARLINNVQGDQYNDNSQTVVNAQVVYVQGEAVVEGVVSDDDEEEYHQFRNYIRGDLYSIKEVYRDTGDLKEVQFSERERKLVRTRARRTVQTSEVRGEEKLLTVVSYHGEEALTAWRRDFKRYSQTRSPNMVQLFGINRSKIPSLIFYDEMIPFAQAGKDKKEMTWMQMYIHMLERRLNCNASRLWIDCRSGCIRSGLDVQGFLVRKIMRVVWQHIPEVPFTVEMLNENTFTRYLCENGSSTRDMAVLTSICYNRSRAHIIAFLDPEAALRRLRVDDAGIFSPDFSLEDLRFDTVYSNALEPIARLQEGMHAIKWFNYTSCFVEDTVVESGMTRLRFTRPLQTIGDDEFFRLLVPGREVEKAWLAQHHGVLTAIREAGVMCTTQHLLTFKTEISPWLVVNEATEGRFPHLSESDTLSGASPVDPLSEPIYLFLPPPPLTLARLKSWSSYWSRDKDGERRLSKDECLRLCLPRFSRTPWPVKPELVSWPQSNYDEMYRYQLARGFDPKSTQFAESLGLPIWEPILPQKDARSEEIQSSSGSTPWWSFGDLNIPAFGI
ncbi:hypothetical protein WG66_011807 [Moniliophthora roreri]|nr:hypothetical protein WG66_011807 [Moniliophthora roreri]